MATTATGARRPTLNKMIYLQRIQDFDHDQTDDYFPDFRQSFPKQSRVTRTFLYSEKHFQTSESTLRKNNNLHVLLGVSVTAFPEAKGKRGTQSKVAISRHRAQQSYPHHFKLQQASL
jgi:hypothetical protein